MRDNKPIGVFDSGVGGLTVVKQIKKILPSKDIIYLGDTARVPYGTRSKETVTKFSFQDAYFLAGQGVGCIVIACNTASAFAGEALKKKLRIPIFDVIGPTVASAVRVTQNNRIGVIGTRGTVGSHAYKDAISSLDDKIKVYEQPCPLFVPFIEEGETKGTLISLLAKQYLADLKKENIDTLIMGCTHYPIIEEVISKEMDSNVMLVNPGLEVSKELALFFEDKKRGMKGNKVGKINYYVTDLTPRFLYIAEMFMAERLKGQIQKVGLE